MFKKMKIEKIVKIKNGEYKLVFNNGEMLICSEEVILKNNLLFNKNIDSQLLLKIKIDTNYYKVYTKVIKYIEHKLRSELEIDKYIDKLGVVKSDKIKIIDELKKINLINDYNYVKAFINDKLVFSNDGPNKIKKQLSFHNIDSSIIEQILVNYDSNIFEERILNLIDKKVKRNNKYSTYLLKKKILIELINMGYDREMSYEFIKRIKIQEAKILQRQYNYTYNKLSKKYSGDDLDYKVRKTLFKKGFSLEHINNIKKKRID